MMEEVKEVLLNDANKINETDKFGIDSNSSDLILQLEDSENSIFISSDEGDLPDITKCVKSNKNIQESSCRTSRVKTAPNIVLSSSSEDLSKLKSVDINPVVVLKGESNLDIRKFYGAKKKMSVQENAHDTSNNNLYMETLNTVGSEVTDKPSPCHNSFSPEKYSLSTERKVSNPLDQMLQEQSVSDSTSYEQPMLGDEIVWVAQKKKKIYSHLNKRKIPSRKAKQSVINTIEESRKFSSSFKSSSNGVLSSVLKDFFRKTPFVKLERIPLLEMAARMKNTTMSVEGEKLSLLNSNASISTSEPVLNSPSIQSWNITSSKLKQEDPVTENKGICTRQQQKNLKHSVSSSINNQKPLMSGKSSEVLKENHTVSVKVVPMPDNKGKDTDKNVAKTKLNALRKFRFNKAEVASEQIFSCKIWDRDPSLRLTPEAASRADQVMQMSGMYLKNTTLGKVEKNNLHKSNDEKLIANKSTIEINKNAPDKKCELKTESARSNDSQVNSKLLDASVEVTNASNSMKKALIKLKDQATGYGASSAVVDSNIKSSKIQSLKYFRSNKHVTIFMKSTPLKTGFKSFSGDLEDPKSVGFESLKTGCSKKPSSVDSEDQVFGSSNDKASDRTKDIHADQLKSSVLEGSLSPLRKGSKSLATDGSKSLGIEGSKDFGSEGSKDFGSEGSKHLGTEGSKHLGTEGSKHLGTEGSKHLGTEGSKNLGTEGSKHLGTEGSKHLGTEGSKHLGTEGSKHLGTEGSKHLGTEGSKHLGSEGSKDLGSEGSKDLGSEGSKDLGSEGSKDLGSEGSKDLATKRSKDFDTESSKDFDTESSKDLVIDQSKSLVTKQSKIITACEDTNHLKGCKPLNYIDSTKEESVKEVCISFKQDNLKTAKTNVHDSKQQSDNSKKFKHQNITLSPSNPVNGVLLDLHNVTGTSKNREQDDISSSNESHVEDQFNFKITKPNVKSVLKQYENKSKSRKKLIKNPHELISIISGQHKREESIQSIPNTRKDKNFLLDDELINCSTISTISKNSPISTSTISKTSMILPSTPITLVRRNVSVVPFCAQKWSRKHNPTTTAIPATLVTSNIRKQTLLGTPNIESAQCSFASPDVSKADVSATQADVSATQVDVSATQVDVSATQADVSATQADVSATQADVSATQADVSATQADTSATQADTSATQADASATQADASATQADASATQADASATQADASATQADASATQADASATQADASATQADASATQADASATQADASATLADASATLADASATLADVSATLADVSATQADVSDSPTDFSTMQAVLLNDVSLQKDHGAPPEDVTSQSVVVTAPSVVVTAPSVVVTAPSVVVTVPPADASVPPVDISTQPADVYASLTNVSASLTSVSASSTNVSVLSVDSSLKSESLTVSLSIPSTVLSFSNITKDTDTAIDNGKTVISLNNDHFESDKDVAENCHGKNFKRVSNTVASLLKDKPFVLLQRISKETLMQDKEDDHSLSLKYLSNSFKEINRHEVENSILELEVSGNPLFHLLSCTKRRSDCEFSNSRVPSCIEHLLNQWVSGKKMSYFKTIKLFKFSSSDRESVALIEILDSLPSQSVEAIGQQCGSVLKLYSVTETLTDKIKKVISTQRAIVPISGGRKTSFGKSLSPLQTKLSKDKKVIGCGYFHIVFNGEDKDAKHFDLIRKLSYKFKRYCHVQSVSLNESEQFCSFKSKEGKQFVLLGVFSYDVHNNSKEKMINLTNQCTNWGKVLEKSCEKENINASTNIPDKELQNKDGNSANNYIVPIPKHSTTLEKMLKKSFGKNDINASANIQDKELENRDHNSANNPMVPILKHSTIVDKIIEKSFEKEDINASANIQHKELENRDNNSANKRMVPIPKHSTIVEKNIDTSCVKEYINASVDIQDKELQNMNSTSPKKFMVTIPKEIVTSLRSELLKDSIPQITSQHLSKRNEIKSYDTIDLSSNDPECNDRNGVPDVDAPTSIQQLDINSLKERFNAIANGYVPFGTIPENTDREKLMHVIWFNCIEYRVYCTQHVRYLIHLIKKNDPNVSFIHKMIKGILKTRNGLRKVLNFTNSFLTYSSDKQMTILQRLIEKFCQVVKQQKITMNTLYCKELKRDSPPPDLFNFSIKLEVPIINYGSFNDEFARTIKVVKDEKDWKECKAISREVESLVKNVGNSTSSVDAEADTSKRKKTSISPDKLPIENARRLNESKMISKTTNIDISKDISQNCGNVSTSNVNNDQTILKAMLTQSPTTSNRNETAYLHSTVIVSPENITSVNNLSKTSNHNNVSSSSNNPSKVNSVSSAPEFTIGKDHTISQVETARSNEGKIRIASNLYDKSIETNKTENHLSSQPVEEIYETEYANLKNRQMVNETNKRKINCNEMVESSAKRIRSEVTERNSPRQLNTESINFKDCNPIGTETPYVQLNSKLISSNTNENRKVTNSHPSKERIDVGNSELFCEPPNNLHPSSAPESSKTASTILNLSKKVDFVSTPEIGPTYSFSTLVDDFDEIQSRKIDVKVETSPKTVEPNSKSEMNCTISGRINKSKKVVNNYLKVVLKLGHDTKIGEKSSTLPQNLKKVISKSSDNVTTPIQTVNPRPTEFDPQSFVTKASHLPNGNESTSSPTAPISIPCAVINQPIVSISNSSGYSTQTYPPPPYHAARYPTPSTTASLPSHSTMYPTTSNTAPPPLNLTMTSNNAPPPLNLTMTSSTTLPPYGSTMHQTISNTAAPPFHIRMYPKSSNTAPRPYHLSMYPTSSNTAARPYHSTMYPTASNATVRPYQSTMHPTSSNTASSYYGMNRYSMHPTAAVQPHNSPLYQTMDHLHSAPINKEVNKLYQQPVTATVDPSYRPRYAIIKSSIIRPGGGTSSTVIPTNGTLPSVPITAAPSIAYSTSNLNPISSTTTNLSVPPLNSPNHCELDKVRASSPRSSDKINTTFPSYMRSVNKNLPPPPKLIKTPLIKRRNEVSTKLNSAIASEIPDVQTLFETDSASHIFSRSQSAHHPVNEFRSNLAHDRSIDTLLGKSVATSTENVKNSHNSISQNSNRVNSNYIPNRYHSLSAGETSIPRENPITNRNSDHKTSVPFSENSVAPEDDPFSGI